jgi:hypothetical protein
MREVETEIKGPLPGSKDAMVRSVYERDDRESAASVEEQALLVKVPCHRSSVIGEEKGWLGSIESKAHLSEFAELFAHLIVLLSGRQKVRVSDEGNERRRDTPVV